MTTFTPMTSMPKVGDPWYNNVKDGGYNTSIRGNPNARVKGLTSLPNCVGFVTGRFNQIGNFLTPRGECKYIGDSMAYYVITMAKNQGLEISPKPTLGGIMCWSGGAKGEGHVEVVEKIYGEDSILTSASEYYGKPFRNFHRLKGDGNWRNGCTWMGKTYHYQGCVKNPAVEDDMTLLETEALIRKMFPALFDTRIAEYEEDLKTIPADSYAKEALEWARDNGLMVGSASGNLMPQSRIKREDVAVILKAYDDMLKKGEI